MDGAPGRPLGAAATKGDMMSKLVLMMGVSLDGLVARPGAYGAGDWGLPPEDPDLTARKLAWIGEAGAHLMGRVTYQEMAGFWPTSDHEYAKPMNDLPKVVFSTTLTEASWPQSTIASGDLADEIGALKRQPGKDLIAWGGAAFAQSLNKLGLVDEYRLVHQPVALGEGFSLFAGLAAPLVLDLIEARPYGDGSVLQVYRPAGAAAGHGRNSSMTSMK
jgi:dihydrofolate reductase